MENEIIKKFVDRFMQYPLNDRGERLPEKVMINTLCQAEEVIKFLDSELKALKEECVGKEKESNKSVVNVIGSDDLTDGYNEKREEIIKVFAKRGV